MQSEDKNDSIQFSKRYWAYMLAKRHLRGECRPEVFPIRGANGKVNSKSINDTNFVDMTTNNPKVTDKARCLKARYNAGMTNFQGDNSGVLIKEATKKGYAEAKEGDSINITMPESKTRRGRVGKGIANTLETNCNQGVVINDYSIRKLTPKECFRLQGFHDELFEKAQAVNSNSQLYKQAGNSVTCPVIYDIARRLI